MIILKVINVTPYIILYVFIYYHITYGFPAAQIRFLAKSELLA
ncbi:hypothetical protein AKN40_2632 [Escherichia coli]|nr:hypothetical protein AKN40_2632 [Escherichia coli]